MGSLHKLRGMLSVWLLMVLAFQWATPDGVNFGSLTTLRLTAPVADDLGRDADPDSQTESQGLADEPCADLARGRSTRVVHHASLFPEFASLAPSRRPLRPAHRPHRLWSPTAGRQGRLRLCRLTC